MEIAIACDIFSLLLQPASIFDFLLARSEVSVTELAAPFEMSLPAVSKHLRILETEPRFVKADVEAGAQRPRVAVDVDGRRVPPEVKVAPEFTKRGLARTGGGR